MDHYELFVQEAIDYKLPTRATEWQQGVGHREMRDYRIKLTNSKANKVYWAYFNHLISHPADYAESDAQIRQYAHHSAKIAIAYLECHCHHCRFLNRGFCPEVHLRILLEYKYNYPIEYLEKYGSDLAFFYHSPCLIMEAMRERQRVMATLFP